MDRNFKERLAFDVLIIMGILALFCLIMRLWPLIFLVIPGILAAALRLLYISAKNKAADTDDPAVMPAFPMPTAVFPAVLPQTPQRAVTEQDVIRMAYVVLQRRVSEQLTSRYPAARWIWEAPDAFSRFAADLSLNILLNRACGLKRAAVQVHNLQFRGLVYEGLRQEEPPLDIDADGDTGNENEARANETVDYTLIAFQWTDANLLELNNRCNDAVANGQTDMLISARDLPHPDSWPKICSELTRNGFSEAAVRDDGINVVFPNTGR